MVLREDDWSGSQVNESLKDRTWCRYMRAGGNVGARVGKSHKGHGREASASEANKALKAHDSFSLRVVQSVFIVYTEIYIAEP